VTQGMYTDTMGAMGEGLEATMVHLVLSTSSRGSGLNGT
jgi:hypothetical protein